MPTFAERFWTGVERRGPDECWTWLRSRKPAGYGQIGRDGKNLYAHRVAYELAVGPIPPGLSVLHSCDNPPCCNPRHLFVGTQLDNVRDAIAKGRASKPPLLYGDRLGERRIRGEAHALARLTEVAVREIRAGGVSQHELARRFGVSRPTIRRILRRERWAHVA